MKNEKLKLKAKNIFCFAFLFFAFSFTLYALAANRPSPTPPTPTPARWTWTEKIAAGEQLLRDSPPLVYEYKSVRNKKGKLAKTSDLLRKQITVAILDTNTGGLMLKTVWAYEDEIKRYRQTNYVHFEPADPSETVDIQPQQWNSFNTYFTVVDRPELVVVADKYLLESKYLAGLPEQTKAKYSEIIYAPYSEALHQPELLAAGRTYLNAAMDAAYERLAAGVVSNPVSQDFVKNIILVEHVDPDLFAAAADGGKLLSERVLAIIGANGERAYRWTGSPAGANGLAQFIRPTYNTIVKKYPAAGLIKDYNQGMADHVNAVEAMVLFFDAYKKAIAAKVSDPTLLVQLGISDEMLAATYNGGVNRVTKSLNKYGASWFIAQIDLPKRTRTLAGETLSYLKKFLAIRELNLLK